MSSVPFLPSVREAQEQCLFDSSMGADPKQAGMRGSSVQGGDGRNPIESSFSRMTSDNSNDSDQVPLFSSKFDHLCVNGPCKTCLGVFGFIVRQRKT